MNAPSIVSSSDMPAANRIGRHRIAYHGSPPLRRRPPGSSATSVAVSKPRPNRMPERVHLPRLAHRAREAAEKRFMSRATSQLLLELGLVVPAAAHSRKTRTMPTSTTRFKTAIRYRKVPDTLVPMRPGSRVQRRAVVLRLAGQRRHAEREEQRKHEDDRRVPEREEEADAQRPLALAHELARRVVDRRDVIGVERVAQPQRVRRQAHAGARTRRRRRG